MGQIQTLLAINSVFCSVFREVALLPGKEGSVGIGATEGRPLVSYTTHPPPFQLQRSLRDGWGLGKVGERGLEPG